MPSPDRQSIDTARGPVAFGLRLASSVRPGRLGVVAGLAERLPVALVPEQGNISLVILKMVDNGSTGQPALLVAVDAVGIEEEERRASPLPFTAIGFRSVSEMGGGHKKARLRSQALRTAIRSC